MNAIEVGGPFSPNPFGSASRRQAARGCRRAMSGWTTVNAGINVLEVLVGRDRRRCRGSARRARRTSRTASPSRASSDAAAASPGQVVHRRDQRAARSRRAGRAGASARFTRPASIRSTIRRRAFGADDRADRRPARQVRHIDVARHLDRALQRRRSPPRSWRAPRAAPSRHTPLGTAIRSGFAARLGRLGSYANPRGGGSLILGVRPAIAASTSAQSSARARHRAQLVERPAQRHRAVAADQPVRGHADPVTPQ